MGKESKFTEFDSVGGLTTENAMRLYLESMRASGTAEEIRVAENDARRACKLYGFDPAAMGLHDGK